MVSNDQLNDVFKAKQIAGGLEKTFFHHSVLLIISVDLSFKTLTYQSKRLAIRPFGQIKFANESRCLFL